MKELINSENGDLRIYFIAIKHWCVCDVCLSCQMRVHDKYQAIKIGKTKQRQLKKRLGDIQTGTPSPYVLLKITMGTDALEKALKDEFETDCLLGEWFKPTEALLLRIAELPMFH